MTITCPRWPPPAQRQPAPLPEHTPECLSLGVHGRAGVSAVSRWCPPRAAPRVPSRTQRQRRAGLFSLMLLDPC